MGITASLVTGGVISGCVGPAVLGAGVVPDVAAPDVAATGSPETVVTLLTRLLVVLVAEAIVGDVTKPVVLVADVIVRLSNEGIPDELVNA
jgi:hypothetical protein